jgi:hypothetical protein
MYNNLVSFWENPYQLLGSIITILHINADYCIRGIFAGHKNIAKPSYLCYRENIEWNIKVHHAMQVGHRENANREIGCGYDFHVEKV